MDETFEYRLPRSCQSAWWIAREIGASILTYQLYPLGIGPTPLPTLPRLPYPQPAREETPILFIHGVFHNPSTFAWLKQRLAWLGWRNFHELSLYTSLRPIAYNAELIAQAVERIRKQFSVKQIDMIAHSMGGILARYYLRFLKGDGRVRNLVTLATPHQGTSLSRYALFSELRELSPDSKLFRRLKRSGPPKKTRVVAISGELDLLIKPTDHAFWPEVRNIRLRGVGHAGVLFSRRVLQIITSHLQEDSV